MKKFIACLAVGLALLITAPAWADVIVGIPPDPGSGNCFPFGCAYNAEYQQIYAQTEFPDTILITDLEFFNTQYNTGATELPTGNWTITLATTEVLNVNNIGSNYAQNLALSFNIQQVWTGNINQAWTYGDTLHIVLNTPYEYHPGQGNLLMDVVGLNVSTPGGSVYFDVNSTNGVMSRVYCPSGVACSDGTVWNGYGLVTNFSTSPVPEPSILLMMGGGLLGVIPVMRRRWF